MNIEELEKLKNDLSDEIFRSKDMINKKGYHNGTAFNQIIRRYRTELKKYFKIILDDYNEIKK